MIFLYLQVVMFMCPPQTGNRVLKWTVEILTITINTMTNMVEIMGMDTHNTGQNIPLTCIMVRKGGQTPY